MLALPNDANTFNSDVREIYLRWMKRTNSDPYPATTAGIWKKKKIYHSCNMYLIKPQQWKDHLAMKIKWGDMDKSFEHDIAGAQLTFLKS